MAYCPRCGVEVEDRLEHCPLCKTHIPEEVRERKEEAGDFPADVIEPKPLYKTLSKKQKKILTAGLIGFLGLFPIAICLGIDLMLHGTITWSYYVTVPLLGAALIAWIYVHYGKRPLISVTAMLLIMLIIQMLIASRTNPLAYFHSPSFPFFIVSFIAIEAFLIYITRKWPGVLKLLSFLFFDSAMLVLAINILISGRASWSLIVISALLPISLYLFYAKQAKKKGLNMIGFLFLDLTLMLTALNYSISRTLSWALVTGLIFLTLAALFYVLHISLYNDTDWKKALHL